MYWKQSSTSCYKLLQVARMIALRAAVLAQSALLYVSLGLVSGNGYSSSTLYNSEGNSNSAHFETNSHNFRVTKGDNVTFPCHVKNKGSNVITWQTGERLLTAGPIKVYNEERLVHTNDGVEISLIQVQDQDSGEYSCRVNLVENPITLSHTLDVLVPPEVFAKEDVVTVKVGGTGDLECQATGNPPPKVHWRRRDGRPVKAFSRGSKLTLKDVTKEDRGVFECVAKNGVKGVEATADVALQILYPPVINVRKRHHHPLLGQDVLILACEVLADPPPDVNWHRGKVVLSGHSPHHNKYTMEVNTDTNTHSLTITNIGEEDYGNYSCHAINRMGEDKATLIVSGKPLRPVITSSSESRTKQSYHLKWRVQSAFPVTNHNVHYQRLSSYNDARILDCDHSNDCMLINVATVDDQDKYRRNDPINVKKEEGFMLEDLIPNSRYLVQIQTVNQYGKSHWSDTFEFNTFGQKAVPIWQSPFASSSGDLSCLKGLTLLLVSFIIYV